jgi:hypothetical protein
VGEKKVSLKRAWSANFKMVWYVLLHSGLTLGHQFFFSLMKYALGIFIWALRHKFKKISHKIKDFSLMVKNGGKVKWERLCSFLAVYLGVLKTLSQNGPARQCDVSFLKALVMYFHWKKIQLPWGLLSWGNCIWNWWIFSSRPVSSLKCCVLTKKFSEISSEISLQLL